MSKFSLSSRIPSCHVTKDLVRGIEEYLISKIENQLKAHGDNPERDLPSEGLSVTVQDGLGIEVFKTISDHKLQKFSDDTNKIEIELSNSYDKNGPKFSFRIQFSTNKDLSRIQLRYEGNDSREFMIGVLRGVHDRISTNKTLNWIYHPPAFIDGLLSLPMFFATVVLPFLLKDKPKEGILLLLILLPCWGYAYLGRRMKPYVSFDTNLTDKYDAIWKWFIGGLFSFILFSYLFRNALEAVIR